jgi:hypothetical protein
MENETHRWKDGEGKHQIQLKTQTIRTPPIEGTNEGITILNDENVVREVDIHVEREDSIDHTEALVLEE